MRGGTLRHRIQIQAQQDTDDGMGGKSLVWVDVSGMSSVPAAIWPLSSKDRIEARKTESIATHRIRVRYRSGISSKNRIMFGSRVFNILGQPINFEERNKYLDIIAEERE